MMYTKITWTVAIVIALFTFQSCTDDSLLSNLETTEEAFSSETELRGGGHSHDDDVSELNSRVLTDWMDLFLELDRYAYGMRPTSTARAIAYINLAAYETAVPGMDDMKSNSGALEGLDIDYPEDMDNINYQVALNTSLATVMDHFLINVDQGKKSQISQLESKIARRFSRGNNGPRQGQGTQGLGGNGNSNTSSEVYGKMIANQIIAYAKTDSQAESQINTPQPTSYEPPVADGYWTYSADEERALFPYWGKVRTFIASTEETSTVAPLQYSNAPGSPYYNQMKEVYEANNSAKEAQGEQLWIAEFWSDDVEGLMFSPPARQISISNQLIKEYDIDLQEALYLNLKLGFALNDAAVSCWADKYEYMVMRPSVFIQDNIDPNYQTNLFRLVYWPNPSFPGYPSGHSTFASAAGGVFIDFFGDEANFTDKSHAGREEFLGEPRTFSTFSEMAYENAFSRIPLGVHIEIDCAEGLRLGYEIADSINEYSLEGS